MSCDPGKCRHWTDIHCLFSVNKVCFIWNIRTVLPVLQHNIWFRWIHYWCGGMAHAPGYSPTTDCSNVLRRHCEHNLWSPVQRKPSRYTPMNHCTRGVPEPMRSFLLYVIRLNSYHLTKRSDIIKHKLYTQHGFHWWMPKSMWMEIVLASFLSLILRKVWHVITMFFCKYTCLVCFQSMFMGTIFNLRTNFT